MIVNTFNYGDIECSENDLISFPDGILGFPELKQYLMLSYDEDDTIQILQSVQQSEVSFVVLNPFLLCPDYTPILTPEELAALHVAHADELCYYVICVIRDNYLDNTVNLKCPLVINPTTRKGLQVIMDGTPYRVRHRFDSFPHIANPDHTENRE